MTMEDTWLRLGALVRQRRDELDMTQSQVQENGGPSPALIRSIESGRARTVSRSKRRDLERALGWRMGSIDDILEGGEPAPASEPVDIPNIKHHPDPGGAGGQFEVTREMGGFEPLKLFGLALLADQLSDSADDFAKGATGPERLIALAHKTYHASMELLADALGVDVAEARATMKGMGYMFDDLSSSDISPPK
ncbi:hypothetical protein [Micromonospora sp. NPDC048169]|uniref:helix-turn-helix domain-containing protein n=1 Tax=Micromonospora sp. NPDC048169 TaxID=3154711 RepID=UPI0034046040